MDIIPLELSTETKAVFEEMERQRIDYWNYMISVLCIPKGEDGKPSQTKK